MPQNLWKSDEASRLSDLDGLVYRSNLLGRDPAVVNIYGGNTSAKLIMTDHVGRQMEVLAVKASDSDIYDSKEKGFALLKMDEVMPTFQRETTIDEEMVEYPNRTAFEQGRPRQSIETLLHAFVPFKHVDHSHPDAVISGPVRRMVLSVAAAFGIVNGKMRAKQYGVSADDLNDFYKQRNTLKVEILPEDIAESRAFLGGVRASKTTGAVLTVDRGVSIAYVR